MPENLFQKGEGIQRIKTVYMLIGKRKNGILEIWNDGRMNIKVEQTALLISPPLHSLHWLHAVLRRGVSPVRKGRDFL